MKHHRILAVILCLVLVIGLSTAAHAAWSNDLYHSFFAYSTDDYFARGRAGYMSNYAVARVDAVLTTNSSLVESQLYSYAHVEGKDNNGRPWVFECADGRLTAVAAGYDNYARITNITCYFEWLDHTYPEEDFQY